jgi:hypothetical protein
MADISPNVDEWNATEASNSPSGATTIGTNLDDNLRAIQAGIKVWASRFPFDGGQLINGRVVASVADSALTLAIKGKDGNDPSPTNKVYAAFRSSTASSSDWNIREITAAISLVVPSGATLGHASGFLNHLFAYLIDNSGTVELAVSNLPPDYPGTFGGSRLVSSTSISDGADSATVIYSTTGRNNVPWICVAMCKSTQATAGTWATAISQIDMAPFSIPQNIVVASRSTTQTIANATFTKLQLNVEVLDPYSVYDAATNFRFQPNVAGYYHVSFQSMFGTVVDQKNFDGLIYKNGSAYVGAEITTSGTAGGTGNTVAAVVQMNGTSDYIEGYVFQNSGGNLDIYANDIYNKISIMRIAA